MAFGQAAAPKLRLLSAALHLDSTASDGAFTPEEYAHLAREKGVQVILIADHDNKRIEYGLFRTSRRLRLSWELPSIRRFGARRYLELVRQAQQKNTDVVVMHGCEALPHYSWSGWPLMGWTIRNLSKSLLVVGLREPGDYEQLPSLAAGNLPRRLVWWMLLLVLGLAAAGIAVGRSVRMKRVRIGADFAVLPVRRRWLEGRIILALAVVLAVDSFPFTVPVADPYSSRSGEPAYQAVIDYVRSRGGLAFWAHPDTSAEGEHRFLGVPVRRETPPYPEALLHTRGYTGFGIFAEGMQEVGRPGGTWDQILIAHCRGDRDRPQPIWAIGEINFQPPMRPRDFRETLTFLWVEERSERGVLQALRRGRMYATTQFAGDWLEVEEFALTDGGSRAESGGVLRAPQAPTVHVRLKEIAAHHRDWELELIRDGKVVQTFTRGSLQPEGRSFPMSHPVTRPTEKTYFRFLVRVHGEAVLASNPILLVPGGPAE